MKITEEAPIEVTVYRSKLDGALVVEIDTTDETGDVRINLNDAAIWEGDPDSITSDRELISMIREAYGIAHAANPDQPVTATLDFAGRVEQIIRIEE
jgi:hypothetical protein